MFKVGDVVQITGMPVGNKLEGLYGVIVGCPRQDSDCRIYPVMADYSCVESSDLVGLFPESCLVREHNDDISLVKTSKILDHINQSL